MSTSIPFSNWQALEGFNQTCAWCHVPLSPDNIQLGFGSSCWRYVGPPRASGAFPYMYMQHLLVCRSCGPRVRAANEAAGVWVFNEDGPELRDVVLGNEKAKFLQRA